MTRPLSTEVHSSEERGRRHTYLIPVYHRVNQPPLTPILVPLCPNPATLDQKGSKVGDTSPPDSPLLPRPDTERDPLANKTSPKIRSSWEAPHNSGVILGHTCSSWGRARHGCSKHRQEETDVPRTLTHRGQVSLLLRAQGLPAPALSTALQQVDFSFHLSSRKGLGRGKGLP